MKTFCDYYYCIINIGGYPGERGLNLLHRADGRVISLGPKTAVHVYPGVSTKTKKKTKKQKIYFSNFIILLNYDVKGDGRFLDIENKQTNKQITERETLRDLFNTI